VETRGGCAPGVSAKHAETFGLRNLQTAVVVGRCVAPDGTGICGHRANKYSKTCLKRNAIVPVFLFCFHRFPFDKGLCFNKTKYEKYDCLGLQRRNNLK
jgi:hypothetical protein